MFYRFINPWICFSCHNALTKTILKQGSNEQWFELAKSNLSSSFSFQYVRKSLLFIIKKEKIFCFCYMEIFAWTHILLTMWQSKYIIKEKWLWMEAITLIDKLREITLKSNNGTNMPRAINNRSENEERRLNGSAPDCKSVVLGSNPAPPQHTANSVIP